MIDKPERDSPSRDAQLADKVGAGARRKLRAKRHAGRGVLRGLGMMGMVGWSVALPTLLGVFAGRWLDRDHPGERSWTLALLVAGLIIGCINAWHWVGRTNKSSRDVEENGE